MERDYRQIVKALDMIEELEEKRGHRMPEEERRQYVSEEEEDSIDRMYEAMEAAEWREED